MIRECGICGKKFESKASQAKYCSDECRQIAMKRSQREYDKQHRLERNLSQQKWKRKNKEKLRLYSKQYYQKNKEKLREKSKEFRLKNPDYVRNQQMKRKADNCCKRHGGIDNCPFDDCILA